MLIQNDKDCLFSSHTIVTKMKDYLRERGLSKRESEVVIFVVQGLTNKQVADQLCVAEKTVKFHLTNVYKQMKISRRSQIIWTLPVAQFIEDARDIASPNLNTIKKEPKTSKIEDTTIPIGHSPVTDQPY